MCCIGVLLSRLLVSFECDEGWNVVCLIDDASDWINADQIVVVYWEVISPLMVTRPRETHGFASLNLPS